MRIVITIDRKGEIEFISVYLPSQGFGPDLHLKFPVIDNKVQDVPFYHNVYKQINLDVVMQHAQEAIDEGTFDDIV